MLGIVYHINKVPRYNILLGLNATQASGREHTIAQKQYIEPWHAELPFFGPVDAREAYFGPLRSRDSVRGFGVRIP